MEKWFDAIGAGGEALRSIILASEGASPLLLETVANGLEQQEWAMQTFFEAAAAGRIQDGPPITADDVERIRRLRKLSAETKAPSPEMVSLATELIAWFFGPNWRTEFKARGQTGPPRRGHYSDST